MPVIREMNVSEIDRIREIDRSETIREEYVIADGVLILKDVLWEVQPWFLDGRPGHSVQAKIRDWRPIVENGGTMWGAFEGPRLVGMAIYRPDLEPGMAQFAVLHVSCNSRGKGVGSALAEKVFEKARADGAERIYVSAAPTKNTVDFYRRHGFRYTGEVNEELLELEPEDVHMVKELNA